MKKICCALLMTVCTAVAAAPEASLWAFWDRHDAASTATVSHAAWDKFLKNYLSMRDNIALLNYGGVSAADQKALAAYVHMLAQIKVRSLNLDEQRAFWINLYNALTVKSVLDAYPVASIRDINPDGGSFSFFSAGPWDAKLLAIEGEKISLNDIEHRILRPIWRDPRLHYAVNCASLGCPNLAARAYTAANTEQLLNDGAAAYINHRRGVSLENGKLKVSSIYSWFGEDFGGDDAGIIAHLQQHAAPELRAQLAKIVRISGHDYDWSLNEGK